MIPLIIKSLHIIAVVSWMAGLLYLPRLFVYHAECGDDEKGKERFTTMEQRLYKQIMGPSMVASLLLGFAMLHLYRSVGIWLVVKIALVILLITFHVWCGKQIKKLVAGQGLKPKTYRLFNEVPIIIFILITIMVVIKPF